MGGRSMTTKRIEPRRMNRSRRIRKYLEWTRVVTRTLAWACLALSGIFGLIWTPVTAQDAIGPFLTYAWLILTTIGGVVCTVASIFGWKKAEQGAALLVVGGVIAYSLSVWTILSAGETTRLVQAMAGTALVVLVIRSWAEASEHPERIRREVGEGTGDE